MMKKEKSDLSVSSSMNLDQFQKQTQRQRSVPKLRFPGFSDPWERRKLGDVCEIKDSARIPNSEWSESGVPYIRASDITNENIDGVLFISQERYEFYKNRTGAPTKDDVLFNSGGEIGKSLLITDKKQIYVQGGAVLYARTSESKKLVGQYLKTYFETTNAMSYIDVASAGGTMRHFTLKPSQMMPVLIPSLNEQEKIGEYFSYLGCLITLHQRKLGILKQYKLGVLTAILSGKIDLSNGSNFNWNSCHLSDVFSLRKDEPICSPDLNKILTVRLHMKGIVLNNKSETLKPGATKFYIRHAGDFIFGVQNLHNGAFGIIPNEFDGYLTAQSIPSLSFKENICKEFILYYFEANYGKLNRFTHGTGAKSITSKELLTLKIMIPSYEEQIKIAALLSKLDLCIKAYEHQLNQCKLLKSVLLQQMFV